MKKLLIGISIVVAMFVFSVPQSAKAASTYVNGYFKSNGTYVNGYYKTTSNSTKFDNYSTKGNYNPYTGKIGTVNPYKYVAPKYTAPTYKYSPPSYSYKKPSYSYKAPTYSYKAPTYKIYK
jgi:hypothetical protein